jgi:hypothetical protein
MYTSWPPSMPKLRGGHQLCPVALVMVISQFLVLLGLGLVPIADWPGSDLPDIPFLRLCYVNVAGHPFGLDSRKPSRPWPHCP